MTSEQKKVVEKIKKLLRMKRGGTQAEVETALGLAADLARKHGIDLASVNPDESEPLPIGHIDLATSSRLQWECKYSAIIAQNFFQVEALLQATALTAYRGWGRRGKTEHRITFIGTTWDTQIAVYVYHFLVGQFRAAWKTRRGRARNRQAFMHGMFQAICEKLTLIRKELITEAGLVLIGKAVAARKEYLQAHWPGTRKVDGKPDGDAAMAAMRGYLAGRDTNIRTGLTNHGHATPLLS